MHGPIIVYRRPYAIKNQRRACPGALEWRSLPVPGAGRPRRSEPCTGCCTAGPGADWWRSPESCGASHCRQAGPRIQAGNILAVARWDCWNCRLEEPRSLKRERETLINDDWPGLDLTLRERGGLETIVFPLLVVAGLRLPAARLSGAHHDHCQLEPSLSGEH